MSLTGRDAKPGYMSYLPASYQSVGPEENQDLDKILATAIGGGVSQGPAAEFWVATPNVRCRTRVAIVCEPGGTGVNVDQDENTDVLAGTGLLWVCEKDRSRSGAVRSSPARNVVGTAAAPLAIPTDTRLWGYVFELETAGEELYGQFTPPGSDEACKWRIVVRYESVERLTNEEWNQFLGRYGVRVQPNDGVEQVAT